MFELKFYHTGFAKKLYSSKSTKHFENENSEGEIVKKEKVNFKTKTNVTICSSTISSFIRLFNNKLPTFKFYKKKFAEIRCVEFCRFWRNDINSLIRSDFYCGLVIVGKEWKQEGLVIDRKFWYILSSPILSNTVERCATNLVYAWRISCIANESKVLDSQLKQFWKLESIGIKDDEKTLYEKFRETMLICHLRKINLYYPTILS